MNFYNLRQAISESSTRVHVDCGTHEFFGGITESCNEFNQMMNESALGIETDVRMGNEILLEAVSMGVDPENFALINEGIGGTVISKIKAFFKSIVEYVKGLIAKLKTFVAGLSNNTNTWHKKMKAAVEKAAKDRSITADFTWDAYNWDHSKLDGLHTLAENVYGISMDIGGSSIAMDDLEGYVRTKCDDVKNAINKNNTTTDAGELKAGNPQKEFEAQFKTYKEKVKGALGVRGNVDDYKSTLAETVKGKSTSTQKGIDSKYTGMLDYIEKCTDSIEKITDSYEKTKDNFEKIVDMLGNVESLETTDYVSGIPGNNKKHIEHAKDVFSEGLSAAKRMVTYGQGVFNGICSLQVSLTKECAQSYMKTLNKLAMAKPSKK